MLKIPDDLYPKANKTIKQKIVNEYLKFTYETFGKYFKDTNAFDQYIASFATNTDAENFIESGSYLARLKAQRDLSIRIVQIIAVIEKNIKKNHSDILSWISSSTEDIEQVLDSILTGITPSPNRQSLRQELQKLVTTYNEKYGLANNFADFVEQYVSPADQRTLILAFNLECEKAVVNYTSRNPANPKVANIDELQNKGFTIGKAHLPKCYDWKMCYANTFRCYPEKGCLITENSETFNTTLNSVAKLIYSMRSEIVHQASDKTIIESVASGESAFSYLLIKGQSVVVEITLDELEGIFIDALKRFFDNKQK